MDFKCPVCQKAVPSCTSEQNGKKKINAPFFPFCSQRCRLVDLGAWLDGDYRLEVAGKPQSEQEPDEYPD